MLPSSEEGEAQGELGGLGEAVVVKEVLFVAGWEVQLGRAAVGGLQHHGIHIEAGCLVLGLLVDIACGVVGLILVDPLNIEVRHAAERGTHEGGSLLEIEGNVNVIELFELGEVNLEPAHYVGLLWLGEVSPAVMDCDRHYLALLRNVEADGDVVSLLDLYVTLLPSVVLDEIGFPV